MAAYHFDASAAVKRYVLEVGTTWVRALSAPAQGHFLWVSRISQVEVASALARKRRRGLIDPTGASTALARFRQDLLHDYRVVEVNSALIDHASRLADTHFLRAYDAVQLATALHARSVDTSTTLISADIDLNAAARAEGFPVEDPNDHP